MLILPNDPLNDPLSRLGEQGNYEELCMSLRDYDF